MGPRLLIIAGEASGDAHAARLAAELKRLRPGCELRALGGHRLKEAGAVEVLPLAERGVVGFVEVVRSLGFFRRALKVVAEELERHRPAAVILVDFPGFNFRAARLAHAQGIPVIYYIAPQVWAWHRRRIQEMKRWARKILVIFPFEVELYQQAGLDVEFVGHPLIDALENLDDPQRVRAAMGFAEGPPLVGILPGSREAELRRMLPPMLEAARLIAGRIEDARFALPLAETLPRSALGSLPESLGVRVIEHPTYAQRAMLDFALTASGTATLENALLGVPMAVMYKTSWVSYLLARAVIQVRHVGMVNLLAGKTICREFIQHEATPQALAEYACEVLQNPQLKEQIKQQLAKVRDSLGEPGASRRAAKAVLQAVE